LSFKFKKDNQMKNHFNASNLEIVGGSLLLIGQKNISQDNFPKLKIIGGDLHLALSGFTKLPDSLILVKGDVFIIQEPDSLVKSCLEKKPLE
jgi:hypothetical protein